MASRAGRLPLLLLIAAAACGGERDLERPPDTRATPATSAVLPKPPSFAFVPARPWRSAEPSSAPIAPPDAAREAWRALVTRHEPLQRKTPRWQPLPADRSVELAMPEGSAFRCLVTPLEVSPDTNDFGTELTAWVLARRLLCSSDGFAHWTEHGQVVLVKPDGRREEKEQASVRLRERSAAQEVHEIYVTLRADEERREPSVGPPRILAGIEVD